MYIVYFTPIGILNTNFDFNMSKRKLSLPRIANHIFVSMKNVYDVSFQIFRKQCVLIKAN